MKSECRNQSLQEAVANFIFCRWTSADNVKQETEANYRPVKLDAVKVIGAELERIKKDPNLEYLLQGDLANHSLDTGCNPHMVVDDSDFFKRVTKFFKTQAKVEGNRIVSGVADNLLDSYGMGESEQFFYKQFSNTFALLVGLDSHLHQLGSGFSFIQGH